MYTSIELTSAGPIATVTLARPDIHNAFDAVMVGDRAAFQDQVVSCCHDGYVQLLPVR